jgi:peptide/nickel transport system substrate-binding protein
MKLFKKENLYIRTTQETEEPVKKRNWIICTGTAIFVALVIIAMFFVEGSLFPTKDDTEYKTSQNVILPMVSVSSFNPLISKDEDTYYMSKLIYDGLFAFDETMTPMPQLVQNYAINKNDQSIALTLRQGVLWHDGIAFTADDVKYSIDAYKAAGDRSIYLADISKIKNAKVNGIDGITIYFVSSAEMSLDLLTFPILPKHQFDKIGNAVDKINGFRPIGTGAYQYESFDPTSQLTLIANSGYFGEIAKNTLVFRVLPKQLNFFNLLKASNLSLIISKVATRESEISGEDVTVVDFPSNELEYLGFNFLQPDLAKKSVRIAIASAIKPKEIIDESYYGSGITNDSIYFPNYLDADPLKEPYVFDVSLAEEYLKKAGYEDNNEDGYVENTEGEPLTFRILVNSDNNSRTLAAKQIVEFLKDIGLNATTDEVDWETYQVRLKSGDFDLYLGGLKLSKSIDLRNMLSQSGEYNYLGYSNGKLDELLNRMRSGLTPEEMKGTYIEIRDMIHKDLPYFCLLYKTSGAIQSPALVGDVMPSFDNYYRGCENWYCRYEVTPQTTAE